VAGDRTSREKDVNLRQPSEDIGGALIVLAALTPIQIEDRAPSWAKTSPCPARRLGSGVPGCATLSGCPARTDYTSCARERFRVIKEATATVLVFRQAEAGWRLGMMWHPRFQAWAIPGGHVEEHEAPAEAAIQETTRLSYS
jgi:NUDIX domain